MEHFNLENNKFETDEYELVDNAMDNAYSILTGKETYESLLFEGIDRIPLPFNPFNSNVKYNEVCDMLIEHYVQTEEYERCAKLVELKERI
tara:strand:+ start:562 stop:834 length:273 start_codon:yes stop_codon:yes gene_type:complete